MPKNILTSIFLILLTFQLHSQQKYTLSGLISDGRNVIGYLNDENNPLIVKVLTDNINLTLISIK